MMEHSDDPQAAGPTRVIHGRTQNGASEAIGAFSQLEPDQNPMEMPFPTHVPTLSSTTSSTSSSSARDSTHHASFLSPTGIESGGNFPNFELIQDAVEASVIVPETYKAPRAAPLSVSHHLWRALWHDYAVEKAFVDLELWVASSSQPIACHRLVLASVSTLLKRILSEAEAEFNPMEAIVPVYLPDYSFQEVKALVDFVYSHFDPAHVDSTALELVVSTAVAQDLGIISDSFDPNQSATLNNQQLEIKATSKRPAELSLRPDHKRLKPEDDDDDPHEDLEGENSEFKCCDCAKVFSKKTLLQKHAKKCAQGVEALDLKRIQAMISDCSGTLEHIKVEDAFSRNEHKRQTLWKSKKACVNVTGNVDLEDCLDDEVGDRKVERRKASFRAILGIFKPENKSDVIYARPLAYSDPQSTEDVTNQFEDTINLLKMLFGFSDADIYTFPDLVHKHENVPISIETLNERKNRTLINFRQQSVEAIKSVYLSEAAKISRCYEHHEGRRIQSIKRQPDAKVILKSDLELKDLNNVACCLWNEGQTNAIMYPLLPANRKIERSKSSAFCLRVLLDVWCTNGAKFPFSSFILEMYTTICDTVSLKEAVDEALPPNMIDNSSQWNSAYQHPIPPTTNQSLQLPMANQHFYPPPNQIPQQALHHQSHQEQHTPMPSDQGLPAVMLPAHESIPMSSLPSSGVNPQHKDEECNCDIIFDDHVQKRRHILLNHSHGKYQQCKQCSFIGTQAQIQWHQSNAHKEYNCDICGKIFKTHHSALEHATKHDSFHCNICNIDIVGKRKYRIHMDRSHTGTWRCQLCNSEFNCQSSLRNHEKRIHTPDEQKPHRCEECGKGFIIKTALRTHMMNVHIKTRPYACQYGCGATYNDVSNRAHHENKKHGAVFNPDKHKGVVQAHHLGSA